MQDKINETISFYADRLKTHAEIRSVLEKYPELPVDGHSKGYSSAIDLLLHISLLSIDIDISTKYFLIGMLEGNREETSYFGRAVALHCISAIDNGSDCLPARINGLCKILFKYSSLKPLLSQLAAAKRQLNNMQQKHLRYLKSFRNSVYAHRTGKGIEQNVVIGNMDSMELGLVIVEVQDAVECVINALIKIPQAYY